MDFDALERAWQAPSNTPDAVAAAFLTDQIAGALRQRRRTVQGFLGLVGVALTLWSIKVAWDFFSRDFPFDPAREWAVLPLLALPWCALFLVRSQYRGHLSAHPDPYASTPATLRALLDETIVAQLRTRALALLTALAVLGFGLTLHQLHEVGKMEVRHVLQAGAGAAIVLGTIWTYFGVRYFSALKPEEARLRRLLEQYDG